MPIAHAHVRALMAGHAPSLIAVGCLEALADAQVEGEVEGAGGEEAEA